MLHLTIVSCFLLKCNSSQSWSSTAYFAHLKPLLLRGETFVFIERESEHWTRSARWLHTWFIITTNQGLSLIYDMNDRQDRFKASSHFTQIEQASGNTGNKDRPFYRLFNVVRSVFISSSGDFEAFSLATLRFSSPSSLRALAVERASYESNLTVTKAS